MNKLLLLLVGISYSVAAVTPLIREVSVVKNRVDIKVNKQFKRRYLKKNFFVEYEDVNLEQFDYSIVTLPFIMNVISLVWLSGREFEIDEMDTEVYASLQTLKEVFKLFYPKTPWKGRLLPKKLVKHTFTHTSDKIALLFSGGVDSTTSSLVHRDKKQLLITAWGQCALPLHHPKLWNRVYKRINTFAQQYGHETTFLKSNYCSFINFPALKHVSPDITNWRINTIEDIGWAGLIAPIMLSRGIKTLRIGSSGNWDLLYASAASPYITNNISFMGLKFYQDLFSMSRYDKIAYLVDQSNKGLIKKLDLIICQTRNNNITCGSCNKCLLTLALLIGVDADPRDYGYRLSPKDAVKKMNKHIKAYIQKRKCISMSNLWEYENLQQKLLTRPCKLLSRFTKIDFSKKKVSAVDWEELHKRYPHVKGETTQLGSTSEEATKTFLASKALPRSEEVTKTFLASKAIPRTVNRYFLSFKVFLRSTLTKLKHLILRTSTN